MSLRVRGQKLHDAIDRLDKYLEKHGDILEEEEILSDLEYIASLLEEVNE